MAVKAPSSNQWTISEFPIPFLKAKKNKENKKQRKQFYNANTKLIQKHKKIQKTVQKRKPLNNIKYKNKSTQISLADI